MIDAWLLLLIVTAIAIGWFLGRRGWSAVSQQGASPHQPYYKGLNYLLDDQPDGALDAFIEALDVNSETLETHIAVGNLMRRKGEVERAIRIHQNLLSRPTLSKEQLHQAHLELAKDFISAGLLDRAESLLEALVVDAPELHKTATLYLLEILQDEKEWQRAIDKAQQLLPKKSLLKNSAVDPVIVRALSHYCCELAELAMGKSDYHSVRKHINQALAYDSDCIRASLLLAKAEYETAHYDQAIKSLHTIRHQDLAYVSESINLLKLCSDEINGYQAYQYYLNSCLEQHPSVTIVLAIVADIQQREGDEAAADFMGRELKRRPSLRGLDKLVSLHVANSKGKAQKNLSLLQDLTNQLIESKPQYQCHHCGFSGKQLHWLCPSCKHWGEVAPIQGAEGD
ncbi:MAG: lipopolysaccharide biosynthesis regulator YciM [Pseudohongiellaceae bacterium]|jgi:lipopolysaccharide biosynthesis regulator YciM